MRRVFFVLVLAILANVCGLSGQESIPVDSVHFPDARFREYVMANFDADANGILESSELDAVDSIDFGDGHWIYTSLEGIEHFWNLKYLDCGLQELTSLDVTRNAELRYLHCAANDLTVLDVSRNTKLKRLTCWGCLLETLDLSHNDSLEYLNCMEPLNDGTLKSIILPSYSKFVMLWCSGNQLPELVLSGCQELDSLDCHSNDLVDLVLPAGSCLQKLWMSGNHLEKLDLTNCTGLRYLDCRENALTDLLLDSSSVLETLYCESNNLRELNLSGCARLKTLFCDENDSLKKVDVSGCVALESLAFEDLSHFAELDVSGCIALESLSFEYLPRFGGIDISGCASLEELYFDNVFLKELDLSANDSLRVLHCNGTNLISLDLSNNALLEEFEGSGGGWLVPFNPDSTYNLKRGIGAIPGVEDLSRTANWRNAELVDSLVRILDFNCAFSYDYDTRCPNGDFYLSVGLLCDMDDDIPIDSAHFPDPFFRQCVRQGADADSSGYLSRYEGYYLVSYHPFLTNRVLSLDSVPLTGLQGLEYLTGLVRLRCRSCGLDALDVSKNHILQILDCADNNLSSLDVSKNHILQILDCADNNLSSLDVSENSVLQRLDCADNGLSCLNLDGAVSLRFLNCENNELEYLDLFSNSNLGVVQLDGNRLTSLDLSMNPMDGYGRFDTSSCDDNYYEVRTEDGRFDLGLLPGSFDLGRTSNWQGGRLPGNILFFEDSVVTYDYATGCPEDVRFPLSSVQFTLIRNDSLGVSVEPAYAVAESSARVYVRDRVLHVENNANEYTVHSVSGSLIYRGHGNVVPLPATGLYIVALPEKTWKVMAL